MNNILMTFQSRYAEVDPAYNVCQSYKFNSYIHVHANILYAHMAWLIEAGKGKQSNLPGRKAKERKGERGWIYEKKRQYKGMNWGYSWGEKLKNVYSNCGIFFTVCWLLIDKINSIIFPGRPSFIVALKSMGVLSIMAFTERLCVKRVSV